MGIQLKISPDNFEKYDTPEKLNMIYSAIVDLDCRMGKIESHNWVNSVYAFIGGVVGGIIAYFGMHLR